MHAARAVRGGERAGDLAADLDDLAHRQRAALQPLPSVSPSTSSVTM